MCLGSFIMIQATRFRTCMNMWIHWCFIRGCKFSFAHAYEFNWCFFHECKFSLVRTTFRTVQILHCNGTLSLRYPLPIRPRRLTTSGSCPPPKISHETLSLISNTRGLPLWRKVSFSSCAPREMPRFSGNVVRTKGLYNPRSLSFHEQSRYPRGKAADFPNSPPYTTPRACGVVPAWSVAGREWAEDCDWWGASHWTLGHPWDGDRDSNLLLNYITYFILPLETATFFWITLYILFYPWKQEHADLIYLYL